MKVVLAQTAPRLGNIKKNLELHLKTIDWARREKADLVVFPELSLTGYKLRDLVETVAADPERSKEIRELKTLSRDVGIVFGFVEERASQKGLFYNSAAFCAKGRILHIHRKVFLPTFGMFEELRFFAPGRNFRVFDTPWGKMGLMICRDFLHYNASYLLYAGGAETMIVISAAPGRGLSGGGGFASSRMWELMGEAMGRFSQAFVLYCNRVGLEDGAAFAGGSFVFDPMGRRLAQAAYFEPELLIQDLDLNRIRKARKNWPFKRDDKPEVTLEALQRIVHDLDD
ncbi:MAG: nitrilase-related carbon-nitrogen hydrolase [Candidatus Aminicenantes bacterium]|nr:nitrilase-related carbon-nitrogen hydrolase [Candidatus Aminicenantes bacterium]